MRLEKALLMLYAMPGIGPKTLRRWMTRINSPADVFDLLPAERSALPGFRAQHALNFQTTRLQHFSDQAERWLQSTDQHNLRFIPFPDSNFPVGLRHAPDAPLFLFQRGKLPPHQPILSLVGTRQPSADLAPVLMQFMKELSAAQTSTCSGLARGVDALVHRESLRHGLFSMAVVAHGAELAYPLQNQRLAEEIVENGCIWSEYPPGTLPEREFFPQRNRILAAMSQALILVQSNTTGGAMITVKHALRYRRPVFAFAGPFNQTAYAGPLKLIAEGLVKPLLNTAQIWNILGLEAKASQQEDRPYTAVHYSAAELPIAQELQSEPGLCLDQLALRTGQSPAQLLALLSLMELEGKIETLPGNRYKLG
jgi:DNA processing protein